MSNVSECIELYVNDEVVTDAQFRAIILDAHARDMVERATVTTYWNNLREARLERQRLEKERA